MLSDEAPCSLADAAAAVDHGTLVDTHGKERLRRQESLYKVVGPPGKSAFSPLLFRGKLRVGGRKAEGTRAKFSLQNSTKKSMWHHPLRHLPGRVEHTNRGYLVRAKCRD